MYLYYSSHSEKSPISDLTVLNCGFQNCEPSHYFGPAIRDYFLIHYVHSGTGRFKNGKGDFVVNEGGAFLIYPGELTYYRADETTPWVYSWVGFDGLKARQILSQVGFTENNPVLYSSDFPKVDTLFSQMNQIVTGSLAPDFGCIGCLYQILYYLIKDNAGNNFNFKQTNQLYFKKSINFFEESYPYDIKIQEVADYSGLDRTTLFRIFKKECGLSPQEYLIRFRIKKASELLQKTSLGIAEISSSVGMDNAAHFSTIFKKRLDISPRDYRKNPFELTITP